MGERSSYDHGTFSWVELATPDQDAAKSFYGDLLGWDYDDSPVGDGLVYSMAKVDGRYAGAISPQMQNERDMGVPPHWNSYITVDDVDAVSARIAGLGGRLVVEPFDVMDVGRMSVLSDPSGAFVSLWQARSHIGAGVVNAPGAFCWNELGTRDPRAAEDFYSALLGWTFEPAGASAGPPYWMILNGGRYNAGMRQFGDETPAEVPAHWLVYFAVDDLNAVTERAAAQGARVLVPPMSAGPDRSLSALTDPQGAAFALFEGRLDD